MNKLGKIIPKSKKKEHKMATRKWQMENTRLDNFGEGEKIRLLIHLTSDSYLVVV